MAAPADGQTVSPEEATEGIQYRPLASTGCGESASALSTMRVANAHWSHLVKLEQTSVPRAMLTRSGCSAAMALTPPPAAFEVRFDGN